MKSENGRSMVEMLGVLAIIGVLSVGAIAGYSKAMSKYKLNKHMESFNILLNEAIKLLPELQRTYGKNTNDSYSLGSFFHKANLLPDGMTYNQQDASVYDIFKRCGVKFCLSCLNFCQPFFSFAISRLLKKGSG